MDHAMDHLMSTQREKPCSIHGPRHGPSTTNAMDHCEGSFRTPQSMDLGLII